MENLVGILSVLAVIVLLIVVGYVVQLNNSVNYSPSEADQQARRDVEDLLRGANK